MNYGFTMWILMSGKLQVLYTYIYVICMWLFVVVVVVVVWSKKHNIWLLKEQSMHDLSNDQCFHCSVISPSMALSPSETHVLAIV